VAYWHTWKEKNIKKLLCEIKSRAKLSIYSWHIGIRGQKKYKEIAL
jgi:hypothetical protein